MTRLAQESSCFLRQSGLVQTLGNLKVKRDSCAVVLVLFVLILKFFNFKYAVKTGGPVNYRGRQMKFLSVSTGRSRL